MSQPDGDLAVEFVGALMGSGCITVDGHGGKVRFHVSEKFSAQIAALMALRETPLKIRVTVEKDYKEEKGGDPELPFET